MDPCTVGLITVGAGFTLYKILPEIYEKLKEILGDFFYKSVTITLSQNKLKAINLIKFMASFPEYKKTKCINIAIDGQEYEIPLIEIKCADKNNTSHEFSLKANVDNTGNLTNVVVSTWKRDVLSEDVLRLETFDTFLKKFPSMPTPTVVPNTVVTAAIATASPVKNSDDVDLCLSPYLPSRSTIRRENILPSPRNNIDIRVRRNRDTSDQIIPKLDSTVQVRQMTRRPKLVLSDKQKIAQEAFFNRVPADRLK